MAKKERVLAAFQLSNQKERGQALLPDPELIVVESEA